MLLVMNPIFGGVAFCPIHPHAKKLFKLNTALVEAASEATERSGVLKVYETVGGATLETCEKNH